MPDILVGAAIKPADFPHAIWVQENTSQVNITATSGTAATAGSPVVDALWVAPTSGRVELVCGGGLRDNSAGSGRVFMTPATWSGTNDAGTVVVAADATVEHGLGTPAPCVDYCYFSRRSLLTGLTPGGTYYTKLMFWAANSGSADITIRDLLVLPVV